MRKAAHGQRLVQPVPSMAPQLVSALRNLRLGGQQERLQCGGQHRQLLMRCVTGGPCLLMAMDSVYHSTCHVYIRSMVYVYSCGSLLCLPCYDHLAVMCLLPCSMINMHMCLLPLSPASWTLFLSALCALRAQRGKRVQQQSLMEMIIQHPFDARRNKPQFT